MVRVMEFLREVYSSKLFDFVDEGRRTAAKTAFDKGIDCILKCQIRVDGKLTGWCAQHDEVDFSPRPARTYELVTLSGSESVGIVRLLMSLDHPSPAVIAAVERLRGLMRQKSRAFVWSDGQIPKRLGDSIKL